MSDGLKIVLQRIERAKEQRRDLEVEMRAWAKTDAYRVATQFEAETGNTLFYIDHLAEITPKLNALISEILHSLRTALDNLAYQLFLVCRTDPADEGERIYFPIYDDSKTTEADAFGKIKTFRDEMKDAIRKVNPCKSGNLLLWVLHKLDIINKHRRIIVNITIHHSVYFGDAQRELLKQIDGEDLLTLIKLMRPMTFMTSTRTGKRAQVGDVVFVGFPGDEKVNEKLQFTFDIAFDEPGIIEGKSVIETIDALIKIIDGLVPGFAPFLL